MNAENIQLELPLNLEPVARSKQSAKRRVAECKAVWEYSLSRRKTLEMRDDLHCGSPADVAGLLRSLALNEKEQENFICIMLDSRNNLRGYVTVTIGLIDRAQAHAREVFRLAIINGASRVVLAHNHPSGDPTPSPQDLECTRNLVAAGKIVGIEVMDHVIIGERTPARPRPWLSFREENLL